jgi:hypothetical protein
MAALLATAGIAAAQSKEPTKPAADAGTAAPKKRQRVVSDLSGFELLDPAKLKEKPMVAGAARSLFSPKPPVLLAPHLGKLHGANPVFAWRHGARRFHFSLADGAGKELHAADVDGQSYTWPASAPALLDGATYTWTVKPLDPEGTPVSASVVVLTKAERAPIDRALGAPKSKDPYRLGLARAAAFTDARVWYDAISTYSDLITQFPNRMEAYERRATLYAQIPTLQDAADEDFAKADALAASAQ